MFNSRKIPFLGILILLTLHASLRAQPAPIEVRTQTWRVVFSDRGGVPIAWDIVDPAYLQLENGQAEGDDATSIRLIDARVGDGSTSGPLHVIMGSAEESAFFAESEYGVEVTRGEDTFVVRFTSPVSLSGVRLVKTYRFPEKGLNAHLTLKWTNEGDGEVVLADGERGPALTLGPGLGRVPEHEAGLAGGLYAYVEPVLYEGREVTIIELDEEQPRAEVEAGDVIDWAGMHDRYFLFALRPGDPASGFVGATAWLDPGPSEGGVGDASPVVRQLLHTPALTLAPGMELTQEFDLYAGPKQRDALRASGHGLDRILFHSLPGWLRWICLAMMTLMGWIHAIVPSWGVTLILLAVVVRVAIWPLARYGLKAQARVNADNARLRPHIERIKAECRGDAMREHQEIMKLYKEHGVSHYAPLKGCIWVLIQLPIFIALFNVIGQAWELRGAGFLWIDDLSRPDRLFPFGFTIPLLGSYFNLLPVIMAGTQVLVSNLSSSPGADEKQLRSQRRGMLIMAILFLLLFYPFPSGLILYWTCSNLGQFVQQQIMERFGRSLSAPEAP